MVVLEKLNWIGEVPVTCRGEVIAVAKVEKLRSGAELFHIDLSGKSADILRRGFSMGDLPANEEEH